MTAFPTREVRGNSPTLVGWFGCAQDVAGSQAHTFLECGCVVQGVLVRKRPETYFEELL
jgi:hypothetical protein